MIYKRGLFVYIVYKSIHAHKCEHAGDDIHSPDTFSNGCLDQQLQVTFFIVYGGGNGSEKED